MIRSRRLPSDGRPSHRVGELSRDTLDRGLATAGRLFAVLTRPGHAPEAWAWPHLAAGVVVVHEPPAAAAAAYLGQVGERAGAVLRLVEPADGPHRDSRLD